jgi:hypothetical protein
MMRNAASSARSGTIKYPDAARDLLYDPVDIPPPLGRTAFSYWKITPAMILPYPLCSDTVIKYAQGFPGLFETSPDLSRLFETWLLRFE